MSSSLCINDSPVVCANCFSDMGLRLDAERIGQDITSPCINCGSVGFKKLPLAGLEILAHRYFVWGSILRAKYGAAPLIQFNKSQKTSIDVQPWLEQDIRLIESLLGIGFFYYGPRFWMIGEIEPLKALQKLKSRDSVIDRIILEYPTRVLSMNESFYRVRINPTNPVDFIQYDSPPSEKTGRGRLDVKGQQVLYGSPDLEVCIHECRVSAEDDIFVATLKPTRDLKLLDLSVLLKEKKGITEFESLDLSVNMLFLAGRHAYKITRAIAQAARLAGYDGLIYPSFFSLLRIGEMPFQTTYGISHRRIEEFHEHEQTKTIPNLALFGRPIASGNVAVKCIDRLIINKVGYDFHFGPSGA